MEIFYCEGQAKEQSLSPGMGPYSRALKAEKPQSSPHPVGGGWGSGYK